MLKVNCFISLKQKIINRKARIAVIGLGYVGLPLAVHFAKARFKVFGLDKDAERVQRVNRKESYISDVPSPELASVVNKGNLNAGTAFDILKTIDVVIICVPTPLKRKYTPDISFLTQAVKTIARFLKKETLIILESTTYPGTTEELILPELKKSGFILDEDFFVSFSPERIDPGNKNFSLSEIPKIVGGLTPKSGELTKCLYKKVMKRVIPVSSAKAAEMTKVLENSFRIVNIGWINEMAVICHRMGIDIWEVIEAARSKPFGFMPFYPGLGVGGHCIPEDPLYLYWKARHHGVSSKFIKLAADVNSHMPSYAVERLKDILKQRQKPYPKVRLLVIGVTYKKDIKDLRKSPPLRLIEILKSDRCHVDYFDPLIPYLKIGEINLMSIKFNKENLSSYDCVIIATDHSDINYSLILRSAQCIFDVRNVYHRINNKKIIRY